MKLGWNLGEEQEVGRRGLEYVAAGAGQGTGRPALRRGVGEQTCLFSNSTQGAKIPLRIGPDRTIWQMDLPLCQKAKLS